MAKPQDVNRELSTATETKSLLDIVKKAATEVKMDPVHLVKVAATQIRLNPKLAQCTPESFVGGLIVLEQVGLEPVAGRAYMLPFMNTRKLVLNGKIEWKKQAEVQVIFGYKGISDLFYRHESALTLQMQAVKENDFFEYEYGTEQFLRHKPAQKDRGNTIGFWAQAKMKDGGVMFLYMTKEECIEHAKKHSKAWITEEYNSKISKREPCAPHWAKDCPWSGDEDSMCMKTVLLQLSKNLPLRIETQRALSIDNTSREYRSGVESALDLPDTTTWEEPIETTGEPVKEDQTKPQPVTSKLPKNILDSIETCRKKLNNDGRFMAILGNFGVSKTEEIPDVKTANEIIREISKSYAG